MGHNELVGKYSRLREELADAYAAPVWQSGRIDRLTDEIAETERALASRQLDVPLNCPAQNRGL